MSDNGHQRVEITSCEDLDVTDSLPCIPTMCCCGNDDCAFQQQNNDAFASLDENLRKAGRLGKVSESLLRSRLASGSSQSPISCLFLCLLDCLLIPRPVYPTHYSSGSLGPFCTHAKRNRFPTQSPLLWQFKPLYTVRLVQNTHTCSEI
jgi:hypothetical protein